MITDFYDKNAQVIEKVEQRSVLLNKKIQRRMPVNLRSRLQNPRRRSEPVCFGANAAQNSGIEWWNDDSDHFTLNKHLEIKDPFDLQQLAQNVTIRPHPVDRPRTWYWSRWDASVWMLASTWAVSSWDLMMRWVVLWKTSAHCSLTLTSCFIKLTGDCGSAVTRNLFLKCWHNLSGKKRNPDKHQRGSSEDPHWTRNLQNFC